jgi:hypothetical protein
VKAETAGFERIAGAVVRFGGKVDLPAVVSSHTTGAESTVREDG